MNRRSFLELAASGALLGVANSCKADSKEALGGGLLPNGDRPGNIIVILADDMRWDALRLAGNRIVHTPNLDALIADGILFSNNFVTTSICPTSRASILTGQYARQHGIWDFSTPLNHKQFQNSYPGILRTLGYQVAYVGKWGIGGPLPESGFDYWRGFEDQGNYFDPSGKRQAHLTAFLGHQALEFLESAAPDRPFCLSLGFKAPHVQDGGSQSLQARSKVCKPL